MNSSTLDAAEIAELVALRFSQIFLMPEFSRHVLDSGNGLSWSFKEVASRIVSHNVHHRSGLAKFVDGGNVARQHAPTAIPARNSNAAQSIGTMRRFAKGMTFLPEKNPFV